MATTKFTRKVSDSQKTATLGVTPGPMEQAAAQAYYERGSKQSIEANRWRILAVSMVIIVAAQAAALALLMPLKSIQTIQLNRDGQDRVGVVNADAQRFIADDSIKQAWVIDWVTDLTEINAVTWQRSVERATSRSLGVGVDQIRDYLSRTENQPAQILNDKPNFVREFSRLSVNMIEPNVALVRFSLTSRAAAGTPKIVKLFVLTATLATVKQETREDVLRNPTGLAVQSFKISEELSK